MFDKIRNAASNLGDLDELDQLRQVADSIDFPASKEQIIAQLQRSGVTDELIERVRRIGKEQFGDKADLLASLTGDH